MQKLTNNLYTSDNQFGFKSGHSTVMTGFTLRQITNYSVSLGSPVYICFIDASKAFDRINHNILFKK